MSKYTIRINNKKHHEYLTNIEIIGDFKQYIISGLSTYYFDSKHNIVIQKLYDVIKNSITYASFTQNDFSADDLNYIKEKLERTFKGGGPTNELFLSVNGEFDFNILIEKYCGDYYFTKNTKIIIHDNNVSFTNINRHNNIVALKEELSDFYNTDIKFLTKLAIKSAL